MKYSIQDICKACEITYAEFRTISRELRRNKTPLIACGRRSTDGCFLYSEDDLKKIFLCRAWHLASAASHEAVMQTGSPNMVPDSIKNAHKMLNNLDDASLQILCVVAGGKPLAYFRDYESLKAQGEKLYSLLRRRDAIYALVDALKD